MIITIFVVIIGFSILVIAHELGHFFVAKWSGMKIEGFGLGFPPKIFSYESKKSGTVYSINWIPFGAFVKIKGEDEIFEKGQKSESDSFGGKPAWKRAAVIFAGVAMNLLFAILIFSFLYGAIGFKESVEDSDTSVNDPQIQIIEVRDNSPAYSAGIQLGDVIKIARFDGNSAEIDKISQFQEIVEKNKDKEILLLISRKGENKEINVIPRKDFPEGEGPIGIGLSRVGLVKVKWYQAPVKGIVETFEVVKLMAVFLWDLLAKLFTGSRVPLDSFSGPVGIVVESSKIVKLGISPTLWLFAFISINLFIVNLLPIPALDGGRLVFLAIEKIKGSPVDQKLEQKMHIIGFFALIALILLITIKDVARLF